MAEEENMHFSSLFTREDHYFHQKHSSMGLSKTEMLDQLIVKHEVVGIAGKIYNMEKNTST